MISKEITERIHELQGREWEFVEASRKVSDAESAYEVEKMLNALSKETVDLEEDILVWVEGQPEFADPDPESPEKTPAYFQAAADVLRMHTGGEPFLMELANYWGKIDWDNVG